jgi:hypothetical protein
MWVGFCDFLTFSPYVEKQMGYMKAIRNALRALAANTQPFFSKFKGPNYFLLLYSITSHNSFHLPFHIRLKYYFYLFLFHIHRQHCRSPSCLPVNHYAFQPFCIFFSSPNREIETKQGNLNWHN